MSAFRRNTTLCRQWALVGFGALLSISAPLSAAWCKSIASNVDEFVKKEMVERRIPGMAVAVIRSGKIVKMTSYGKASLEFGLPVKISTRFSVASASKSFTAVAVMMLAEAGKLALSDSIGSYLSELPPAWREVTIRQLLNHTSGIPDIAVDDYSTNMIAETTTDAIRMLKDKPMDFATGTAYRYNQTNFMLLAMLIERVSGNSFVDYVTAQMFRPLDLHDAVFGDSRSVVSNRAAVYTPYRFGGERPIMLDDPEVLHPEFPAMAHSAVGLNISIADFAKWLSALLNGKFISKQSLDTLWSPAVFKDGTTFRRPASPSLWREYGLGWILNLDAPHPFAGGTGGLRCAFFVYPRDGLAVIVLTNWQGSRSESLVDGIARLYLQN